MRSCTRHFFLKISNFFFPFTRGKSLLVKCQSEKELARQLTLQKQIRFDYNNAPLGVKVYCFTPFTQQLHFIASLSKYSK